MNHLELQEIIQDLNNISYNHQDLMSIFLDFSDIYFKNDENKKLDLFFQNPNFLQQGILCVREALVLGVNGLILSDEVNFSKLIDGCVNFELEEYHITEIKTNKIFEAELIKFFNSIRREIFSRIYSQNKSLRKVTELSKNLLDERYNLFMKKFA